VQQYPGAGEQALRNGRLGFGSRSLLQAAYMTLVAGKLAREFWQSPKAMGSRPLVAKTGLQGR